MKEYTMRDALSEDGVRGVGRILRNRSLVSKLHKVIMTMMRKVKNSPSISTEVLASRDKQTRTL